ncbi:hypothetical protein BDQ12DRAFT_666600 [Crucibulum laeve]|uniref:Uncharacterized protein n=1 Tax=Crucibulum laeve TaxID=68775 RepID=A0A5C3LZ79_9AGAR|nr:hypothetical protein BDQ12DRAFT_666600 [Crucibulum laeve]
MVQCIRYLIALALFVGPGIAAVIPPQEFATRDVHDNDLEARKIHFGKFIHKVENAGKKIATTFIRRDEDGVYERDIEDDLFARDYDDILFSRDYEDGLYERDVENSELERRKFSFKKIGHSFKNAAKTVGRGAGKALSSPIGQIAMSALPRDLEDDLYERDVPEDEFYAREVDDIYDLE